MDYSAIWKAAFREAWAANRPMALVNSENGMRTFIND
jgi:hypothetical protein